MAIDKEHWREDLREWKEQTLAPDLMALGLLVGKDELDRIMEVVMDICHEQRLI